MLVIIEGVDETGKTTLAKDLVNYHSSYSFAEYYHSGPPGEQGPLYEYTKALFEWDDSALTVADRFHWGELVYGPEYRGESGIDEVQRYWLDLVVGGLGGQMVLAIDSPEAIYDRVTRNNDDFVRHDLEHLRSLQEQFVATCSKTPLPVWAHSISYPVDQRTLLSAAAEAYSAVWSARLVTAGHVLSTPSPRVLLVGDEPGQRGDEVQRGFPFYPHRSNCGYHLMRALLRTDMSRQVMITNSLDSDGVPVPVKSIMSNSLTLESVVALGNLSSERLTDQGVPHGVVVHPQFARRFHHHDVDGYAVSLIAAAHYGEDARRGGYLGS